MNLNKIKEKRAGYVSADQKTKLFALMQDRPALCSGRFSSSFSKKDGQKEWINIATTLNGIADGKKSWMQWRKTWQDMRCKVKSKQAVIKRHANGTGGGPPLPTKLKQNEEDILSLISNLAVNGHSSVQDFKNAIESNTKASVKPVSPIVDIPQPQLVNNNYEIMDHDYYEYNMAKGNDSVEEIIVLDVMPTPGIKNTQETENILPKKGTVEHGSLFIPTSVKKHTVSSAKKLQVAASAAELLSETAKQKLEIKEEYLKRKLEIMEGAENEKRRYHNKMLEIKEKRLIIEERKARALEKICDNLMKYKTL
ncbi:unnamed protein product [Ceutorhynchus assimilis]|uniref:Regulatory protein zeste n=1 Tax=Ceutorhynchus assimilis TaxID=467358 RepID=A0A9N9MK77_9CUCU|nr:unnamed protein product [Ceutorhynchus assimilis]